MFTIKLRNSTHFICAAEDTILIGAQKANVSLEYSCKDGRCKSCKAIVVNGTTAAIMEEIGLSKEEKEKGFILTCVQTPTSDLDLDIEDLSAYKLEQVRTLPSKIDKITALSASVIELELRIPPNTSFKYLPGQYVNIIQGDLKRSYSIASKCSDSNLVFFIKNYNGGKFSNYLFNEAKSNDLLRIEGPLGTFFFRRTDKSTIIFLATGTGIAPIKAMLEHLEQNSNEISGKNVYLFFGGREIEDLFWKPEFQHLNVNFIPVLSKENPAWKGENGYVQDCVLSKKIDLSDAVIYACGSENMIKDSRIAFLQNGLSEEYFYSDAFISSK